MDLINNSIYKFTYTAMYDTAKTTYGTQYDSLRVHLCFKTHIIIEIIDTMNEV